MALLLWPGMARADGAQLFELHCAGCHVNGGNIIRRGKTLKLAALERENRASEAAIAAIAAAGVGQMSGYGAVLGEEGTAEVAAVPDHAGRPRADRVAVHRRPSS